MVKPRSRQREWQLKQLAAGKCLVCGRKAVNKKFCGKHRREVNAYNRARWHRRKIGRKA